jgi:ABC-type branched-subunit amino acid transport system ATPase component
MLEFTTKSQVSQQGLSRVWLLIRLFPELVIVGFVLLQRHVAFSSKIILITKRLWDKMLQGGT